VLTTDRTSTLALIKEDDMMLNVRRLLRSCCVDSFSRGGEEEVYVSISPLIAIHCSALVLHHAHPCHNNQQ
jgi:hypothetical protein